MTGNNDGIEARLAAAEQRLGFLYAHLGIDPNVADNAELPIPAEIRELVAKGKKVAAIKAYRETFNAGLADATRAIERIAN